MREGIFLSSSVLIMNSESGIHSFQSNTGIDAGAFITKKFSKQNNLSKVKQ
jgi:hypothetical protein